MTHYNLNLNITPCSKYNFMSKIMIPLNLLLVNIYQTSGNQDFLVSFRVLEVSFRVPLVSFLVSFRVSLVSRFPSEFLHFNVSIRVPLVSMFSSCFLQFLISYSKFYVLSFKLQVSSSKFKVSSSRNQYPRFRCHVPGS